MAAVKRLLNEHGAYSLMPVSNGMGAPALDFHCIHKGRAFCIKTKTGNKKMTPRQEITAAAIEKAGGVVFLINETAGMETLRHWLTCKEI